MIKIIFHHTINALGLILACAFLGFASYLHLSSKELPCTLCYLQTMSIAGIGLCVCMNIKWGIRSSHYGLLILSALAGLGIALYQLFMTIPGDIRYHSPLLGSLLYIPTVIIFIFIIGIAAIALLVEIPPDLNASLSNWRWLKYLMILFLCLILILGISTFLQCGFSVCKGNLIRYYLIDTIG